MDIGTQVDKRLAAIKQDRARYRNVLGLAARQAVSDAAIDDALFTGDLLEVGSLIAARVHDCMREIALHEVISEVKMSHAALRALRKEAMAERRWSVVDTMDQCALIEETLVRR